MRRLRLGRLRIFYVRGFRMSEVGLRGLGLGHLVVLSPRVPVLGLLMLGLVLPMLGLGLVELLLLRCCLVGTHGVAAKCAA